jgi:hypothetical protein
LVSLRAIFNNDAELLTPNFASSVYVELVLDEGISDIPKNKYFVDVFFNDENIFNEAMNYTYFSDRIRQRIIKDDEIAQFCKFVNNEKLEGSSALLILVIVFCFLNAR